MRGRTVARRFGAKDPNGGVMRCGPRPDENRNGKLGSDSPKIIYLGIENARTAADELELLYGDALFVYKCERTTKNPHYHLTHTRHDFEGTEL